MTKRYIELILEFTSRMLYYIEEYKVSFDKAFHYTLNDMKDKLKGYSLRRFYNVARDVVLNYYTLRFLERKIYELISSFMEHGFMAERFDRVKNFRTTVAIVPVSAKTGEGIPELLAVLVGLVQAFMMDKLKTSYKEAKGVVLEVKEEVGLGKTMDTIIYDGVLRKNDLIVVGGLKGPVVTTVRALLLPKPLDEIRKPRYRFDHVEEVHAAAGVKIVAIGNPDTHQRPIGILFI